VGGSGRVRALKEVIVGSRIVMPSPLPSNWTQSGHAVPAAGGYYTGNADRTYTFRVTGCGAAGCTVGSGTWTLNWDDGAGQSGSLNFGTGYQSPKFLPVDTLGLTLALHSGQVKNGDTFTVEARTPRDTFQYTINREPYTEPLVIVSYNDPQGNHRFVLPPQAMELESPVDDLNQFSGEMLQDVGVEIVTDTPFQAGGNSVKLLVNNPSSQSLKNANLFLEFIDLAGAVVSEVSTQLTLSPGPTYTTMNFDTTTFDPAFDADQDYIVMAFLTDYQGNILDTIGRPLSSFQVDPLPELASEDTLLTWDFGTLAQGTLAKYALPLANAGYGRLYSYLSSVTGFTLAQNGNKTIGAADVVDYEVALNTADLPVGPLDQTLTLRTSDPDNPTRSLRVVGTITAGTSEISNGGLQRPLDVAVEVPGNHTAGEWYEFEHTLGPEAQDLQPVKVYSEDYSALHGVGKYATDFGSGIASAEMFGDGRDDAMPTSGNLNNNNGFGAGSVSGRAGSTSVTITDRHAAWRINPGDVVLLQTS